MITATFFLLILAAAGFLYRLIVGPSLADRIIGVDGLLAVGAGAVAVEALSTGDGQFIPVIVVITLIGFVSTSVAARFIEAQDTDPSSGNGAVGEGLADRATDGATEGGGAGDGVDDGVGTDPGGRP